MVHFDDISAARTRLAPFINRTPLLTSESVNEQLGGKLFLKAENLQKTGSFKFRGATNRMLQLSDGEKRNGVVAYSSGNHAQGVALAAKLAGVKATIVMPEDAPAMKIENTKRHGATVVLYNRYTESREEIGEGIAAKTGAVLVKPFDDPYIIAGQGTTGLEIAEQAKELGVTLDACIANISGGGLSAGIAIALRETSPATQMYTAEPEHFDDTKRSLEAGERLSNEESPISICDALMAPSPGEITFPIMHECGVKGLVASEEEVKSAMRTAFEEYKLVLEPGGAVALACVLSGKVDATDKAIAVVCTGGNVDPQFFAEIIAN